jgi:hypothetical protein
MAISAPTTAATNKNQQLPQPTYRTLAASAMNQACFFFLLKNECFYVKIKKMIVTYITMKGAKNP